MKNLILVCLFLVSILFYNCDKDDDKIDCDYTTLGRKLLEELEDFQDVAFDFHSNPTASNCRKFKTSGEDILRLVKKAQKCAGDDNYISYQVQLITRSLNLVDCSDFE